MLPYMVLQTDTLFQGSTLTFGSLALACYSALWSYDGWNQLNFVTEEIEKPRRNMPLAIFISIPFITVVYILVNISYLTILSPSDIINSQAVANDWGTRLLSSSSNQTLQFLRYFSYYSIIQTTIFDT